MTEQLILKHAYARDDDYDVLADGAVVAYILQGPRRAGRKNSVDVPQNARLRTDA